MVRQASSRQGMTDWLSTLISIMTNVQKLYDICEATITTVGAVPTPQALQNLLTVLDTIQPIDVGLEDEAIARHDRSLAVNGQQSRADLRWKPPITYLQIYHCEKFSIGIFCLSASAVMPLHNHPGMTVLSKLIYGAMHVRAYDWLDPPNMFNTDFSRPRPARLAIDQVLSAPCEPSILYPTTGGNIHTFTAVTPCAVLDVLIPPYSTEEGRDCTYFREISGRELTEVADVADEVSWLEESQPDFVVRRVFYKGSTVVPQTAA